MIKMVVAMDKNRLIGKNGQLPWHNKEDLRHFRNTTINQTILMGSKTFLNLPKKLLDRKILVLTRNRDLVIEDENVKIVHDINDIINKYKDSNEVLYICGGAKIYEEFFPYTDELIISLIEGDYVGDAYFPSFEESFTLIEEIQNETFILRRYQKR